MAKRYRIERRWARREDGKLVVYAAGSELELTEEELKQLGKRAIPVEQFEAPQFRKTVARASE